jgi:hypothetical protein
MTITLRTPFRSIPALPLSTWQKEFEARQSPVPLSDIANCYAACEGWALLLDQAIGETSLKDPDAIEKKNLLRTTEADGSTFKTYSAFWKPFAIKYKELFDPHYKGGVYYVGGSGQPPGYDLSLAGFKVIYQGGPRCLSTQGIDCANGERYDPNADMMSQATADNPNAPSINRSIAASMLRYTRWFGTTTVPPPPPGTPPPPPTGEIVLGRVPKPSGLQLRVIWNNTAWNDLGPRQPRGIVLHRMLGTLNGTDSFFRGEASGTALTDFGVGRGTYGPCYQWNLLDGRRAPWASGPADGVKGDGVPFVNRYGVNAINRDCASIEIEGHGGDPIPAATWTALVELCAWIADDWLGVSYQQWPKNRDGLHAVLHHREFTKQKECPFAVVIERTAELIEDVRERLRHYQTGA